MTELEQVSMTREQALQVLAERFKNQVSIPVRPDIAVWASNRYYLAPGSSTESMFRFATPINLMQHQKTILRLMFHHPYLKFTTDLFSTVKKSGKTAIGGLVARYLTETSGYYAEVYSLANDEEQARGRIYKAAVDSIENTPGYLDQRKILPMTAFSRQFLRESYGDRAAASEIEWRIIERQAEYTPTKSFIRALSSDYRGEAGSNPTATVWSEIWGLDSEKSRKLWAELTPVPTRPSIRFVETYAGYEDESIILEEVWELAQQGHQLLRSELKDLMLQAYHEGLLPDSINTIELALEYISWPDDQPGYRGHPDKLPLWINEDASVCAYIDQGVSARRMPWQTGISGLAYYKEQEKSLEPIQNERFHHNEWTSTISPFIDLMWWRNCSIRQPLEEVHAHDDYNNIKWSNVLKEGQQPLRPLLSTDVNSGYVKKIPLVISIDGAVSNDYMAATVFSREGPHTVALRGCKVWRPQDQPGGKFDYEETIMPFVRQMCQQYNVVEVCYDPYQMHKVATDLERAWVVTCFPFNQNSERLKSDKQLHDVIRDREIIYDPLMNPELLGASGLEAFELALRQCASKQSKDEDTKYRIVKKTTKGKIDPVVSASMGVERTLYLNLF